MNRSYLTYFKDRNPFKFISNILRYYKKSSDVKRNQSEPTVAQLQNNDSFPNTKPKSEMNLTIRHNEKDIEQWNNSKFKENNSEESLELSSSRIQLNGASSNISLKKTRCHIDLNIQDKLNQIPVKQVEIKPSTSSTKIPLKRAYPWQNFNLVNVRKPRYDDIKEVSDMRKEIINLRKSILRKPEVKLCADRHSAVKEVKFNKTASMMTYPKSTYNVMKQPRIHLSTNVSNVEKPTSVLCRKKRTPIVNVNKVNGLKMYCSNNNYKKNVKKLRKCLPVEPTHLWYLNNAKKEKIF